MSFLNYCFLLVVGFHLSHAYFTLSDRCINFGVKKDFDAKRVLFN